MKFVLGLAMSAALFSAAGAQPVPTPAEAAPTSAATDAQASAPAPPVASNFTLPAGSVVDLELAQVVNSKTNIRGDKVAIRLAQPIEADGRVLVPAGATGMGEVIDAKPAGMLGKSGELLLAARYLDYNGRKIPLRAFKLGGAGKDNSSAVLAVSMAVGLPAVLIRGGNIEIPVGTAANAKLAKDLTLPAADDASARAAPASNQPSTMTQEENPK